MLAVGQGVAALVTSAVAAHELQDMKVTGFSKSSGSFYEINVQDTVKDTPIVCAMYDASGTLVASDTQFADNLATSVLIRYEKDDVASVRCVLN